MGSGIAQIPVDGFRKCHDSFRYVLPGFLPSIG
jgi:hypothetical protein